jgi:hypothetical protein
LAPRLGRFYPQGLLRNFPFSLNLCRCTGLTGNDLEADLNHPLAGQSLELGVTIRGIRRKKNETGGQCQDWLALLLDGPGLQSCWQGQPTDFFQADAFWRQDDRPDSDFYGQPRLVSHLDRQARETISRLYGLLLGPEMMINTFHKCVSPIRSSRPGPADRHERMGHVLGPVLLGHDPGPDQLSNFINRLSKLKYGRQFAE